MGRRSRRRPATTLATAVGAKSAAGIDTIVDEINLAVVATPNELHAEISAALMRSGVHVLIEKPIATTVADGEALVDVANNAGVALMVGQVERFNPAVLELDNLLVEPLHYERCGSAPTRIESRRALSST